MFENKFSTMTGFLRYFSVTVVQSKLANNKFMSIQSFKQLSLQKQGRRKELRA